jgi:RimJ/RimL family protein N-acetyltransferase
MQGRHGEDGATSLVRSSEGAARRGAIGAAAVRDPQSVLIAMVPGLTDRHFASRDQPLSELVAHAQVQGVAAAVSQLNPNVSRQALLADPTWNDVFAWLEDVAEDGSPPAATRPPRGSYVSPSTTLRPLSPPDIELLYRASLDPRVNHRWRFRGGTPSPNEFHQALFAPEVVCQYMVVDHATEQSVGLVTAYSADHMARHVRIAVQRVLEGDAPPDSKGLMIEGFFVFVQYLFDHFNFHKLYVEVPEYNLSLFTGGPGALLTVEGRLRDYFYWGDRMWDMYFLALHREAWESVADHFRGVWAPDHFDRREFGGGSTPP